MRKFKIPILTLIALLVLTGCGQEPTGAPVVACAQKIEAAFGDVFEVQQLDACPEFSNQPCTALLIWGNPVMLYDEQCNSYNVGAE